MSARRKLVKGFTLIELMMTLAVVAVLLLVATPSMVAYKRNSELTSATNTLFASINAARGEAMKRGMYAMVVPTNNGSDWSQGWIVFVDTNRTKVFDASTDKIILTQGPLPSYIAVTGNGSADGSVSGTAPYIMFDPSGYSAVKGTSGFAALTLQLVRNDVASTLTLDQTRRIKIAATGRVRTCKPSSTTDNTCNLALAGG